VAFVCQSLLWRIEEAMADETTQEDEEKEAWALSKSKAILRSGLLNGAITPAMQPKEVFNMHPKEHGKWNHQNWSNNLRNLRNAIERDRERMQNDCINCGHDLAILKEFRQKNPHTQRSKWRGSKAERTLKKDVDEGKHLTLPPKKLCNHKEWPEHREFDLVVFRKHIHQEVDSRPKRAIRFEKKKKAWKCPELHKNHPRLQENEDNNNKE
jgi:hypothetical protein